MALIRFKNQSDYALLHWLSQWPNSGHPLDEQRFMVFAKCVARYRSKKWLQYENFEAALQQSNHHFENEDIEKHYFKLRSFVEFYHTLPIGSVEHGDSGDYGYYQRGVRGGKMYVVPISKEEYFTGATEETLKKAEYFGD